MTRLDPSTDSLVPAWLSAAEAAARLGVEQRRVHQLLHERSLLGFERGAGSVQIPAPFVHEGRVVKGLAGTITLLADAGYDDAEILRWLFIPQETLPGTPVQALAEDRGKEVKRRAQALGF